MLRRIFVTPSFVSFMIRIINDTKLPNMVISFLFFLLLASAVELSLLYLLAQYKVRRLSILYIKTKITSVSIITTIATSNRCELDSLENLFSRESLRLSRIETLAQSATAIVVIMKITEGNLRFYSTT